MKKPSALFSVLVILLAAATASMATTTDTRGLSVVSKDASGNLERVKIYNRTFAVIIGIDKYINLPSDKQLRYAVSDAKAVRDVLKRQYRFDGIIELYNENATREKIMKTLTADLPKQIGKDDSLFIFWAGHGNQAGSDEDTLGYLIPYDGEGEGIFGNITMNQIKDDISRAIPAKHIFYVMDSCYSGLLVTRGIDKSASHTAGYLKEITKEKVRQVLTAGTKGQEVLDGGRGGHSVFTGRLIEVLQATGDYITANEIQAILKEKVFQDARARGHDQKPDFGVLYGSGDYVFIPALEQKVAGNQEELDRLAREQAALDAQIAEAQKGRDAEKLQELERQKRVSDAKLKAEELKKQQLADEQARLASEEKQRQALESQKSEDEKKIAALKADVEKKRKALEVSSGQIVTINDAVSKIKSLSAQIAAIEAKRGVEITASKAQVKARCDARLASLSKQTKDEFETQADFNARISQEKSAAIAERDKSLAELDGILAAETEPLRTEIAGIASKEYTVPSAGLSVELGQYVPEEGCFPVSISRKEPQGAKTLIASNGKVYIPKDKAREFKQHYVAGLASPVVKAVPKDQKYALTGAEIKDDSTGESYPIEFAITGRASKTSPTLGAKFVLVPAGTFTMGSGKDDETLHQVTISKPFYMQTTEVTQAQWVKVMGSNPSCFKDCGGDCPVEQVSWNDVQEFIRKLNAIEGGNKYRLPTEAEWEYTARSGGRNEEYSGGNSIDEVAWYYGNSGSRTHPVGQKKPNGLGLYDMSGNVWEWCSDWYGSYPSGSVTDPVGPSSGSGRVFRGGSWDYNAIYCRAALRNYRYPGLRSSFLGFRLVVPVQ